MRWEIIGLDVLEDWLSHEPNSDLRLYVLSWLPILENGVPQSALAVPLQPNTFVGRIPACSVIVTLYAYLSESDMLHGPTIALKSIETVR